jgi:SAM-dependent methyltransferase
MSRKRKNKHQLTLLEIALGRHRRAVGGGWDTIGAAELQFLTRRGLRPEHYLLDIGCGTMRGGLHFVRYLEPGRYCGIDANPSYLRAGRWELRRAGLLAKRPELVLDDRFDFGRFGRKFDYLFAWSVFTHLYHNEILRCLVEASRVMHPASQLFSTYYPAPRPLHLEDIPKPSGSTTGFDYDPFHLANEELAEFGAKAGLAFEPLGPWLPDNPQHAACFRLA